MTMKFKGAVIGILAAILAITAITAGVLITESKRQTDIALKTAEINAVSANMQMCQTIINNIPADYGAKWFTASDANDKIDTINEICEELGITPINNVMDYEGSLEIAGERPSS